MYLDDERTPKYEYDVIVRSFEDAVLFVEKNGIPNFISFDHDLGCDKDGNIFKSGYDFAKWLVDMDIENIHTFPDDFKFNIHSANPVGRENINSILESYLRLKASINS